MKHTRTTSIREAYLTASWLLLLALGCMGNIRLASIGVANLFVAALLNPEYIGG